MSDFDDKSKGSIKKSYVAAGVFAIVVAAWVASGQIGGDGAAETAAADAAAAEAAAADSVLPMVRVLTITAESRQADLIIRGRTWAELNVEVKSETAGPVIATPAEKGAPVRKGDVLCELDVGPRGAQLEMARAQMQKAQLDYEASQTLEEKGHRSPIQTAGFKAAFEAAAADVKRMEEEMSRTKIRAPFDGFVDARLAEVGAYLQAGGTCAVVVAPEPFLVVGQVSERDVGSVSLGDKGEIRLISGEVVEGIVRFIAKTADPATRTFRVELTVANPDGELRDGVTAEVRVSTRSVMAHHVSPAILTLDDKGIVGVRILDGDVARFVPVEIVSQAIDGVWISGLPETATVITVGQNFVNDGQKVQAVPDSGA